MKFVFESYKSINFIHCFIFLALATAFVVKNEVVAPHRQHIETGSIDNTKANQKIENRKFSDYSNSYIPEISAHLNTTRSSWITLWTNQTELGRPTYHLSGFSPAYLPSWVIAQITTNPARYITILSVLFCFFTGVFFILFCREIDLHPLASLITSCSIAISPLFMYWLTFPMFPAVWCWSACVLWAITRLAKKSDLIAWCGLTFGIYSILMTAYPQAVVYHAYLLIGYGLYLTIQIKQHADIKSVFKFLSLSVLAIVTGLTLSLPVYLDLANTYLESARVMPDISFFMSALPKISTIKDAIELLVFSTTPELFGNPIDPSYYFPYNGLSITILIAFFAFFGLFACLKQTWGWWLAIIILCLFAFIHPLYEFGIKYLALNLSRSTPLGSIMLPLSIIVAYAIDAILKQHKANKHFVLPVTIFILLLLVLNLIYGLTQEITIRWEMTIITVLTLALLSTLKVKPYPILLLTALAITIAFTSYPLILRQELNTISTTSALIDKVRLNLHEGSRYAVIKPGLSVLPPNLNASLNLSSIHSYNSLSPKHYHTLIKKLGGETKTYGRINNFIAPDFNDTTFWMSNIGLILSPVELSHENLEHIGEESGVQLYKVLSHMGDSIQVMVPTKLHDNRLSIGDPRLLTNHSLTTLVDQGDLLEYEINYKDDSIIILSRKFHRDWHAYVKTKSKWIKTQTFAAHGIFQALELPKDTERVRLEFRPYARYAWIAHLFWALILALLLVNTFYTKRQSKNHY